MQNNTTTVAVIDFGTSRIKGALVEKYEDGRFEFINYADQPSDGCIQRGVVYNMEITAKKAQRIIDRLEEASGRKIVKVYVNLGGQSLRTVKHVESLSFDAPHEVQESDVNRLLDQLEGFTHDKYEMLQVDSPSYYVNGSSTTSPVGVQALKIDARYQLIVARPLMRSNLESVISNKLGLEVEEFIISPIAIARTFLTDDQKKLGCVLIDFGAGSTIVSVYRNGLLIGIRTIPLGGSNITKDLTSLHITDSEAEKVKCHHASAISDPGDKSQLEVNAADNLSTKRISRYEVCRYIEARVQEIVDNIDVVIRSLIKREDIGGGVIVTGGASDMMGLVEKLSKTIKMPIEYASSLRPSEQYNRDYVTNPKLHLLYSMAEYASSDCLLSEVSAEALSPDPASTLLDGDSAEVSAATIPAGEQQSANDLTAEESNTGRSSYPEDDIYKSSEPRNALFSDEVMKEVEQTKVKKPKPRLDPGVKPKKTSGFFNKILSKMDSFFPSDDSSDQ